ncbi:Ceramide synthase subunit LIP1 [Kluyveromyces marxianus]
MAKEKYVPQNRVFILLQYIACALALVAAVEYFKYKTRISYEWFHCTPQFAPLGSNSHSSSSSAQKLWAVGGPSCDKRGELKTIMKRITMDYDPNEEPVRFCIVENHQVPSIHYPVENGNKGEAGYVSYVGYERDAAAVEEACALHEATVFNL